MILFKSYIFHTSESELDDYDDEELSVLKKSSFFIVYIV